VGRSLDYEAVSKLEVADPNLKEQWTTLSKWLTDPASYSAVRCGEPSAARLSNDDIDRLAAARTIRRVEDDQQPRAYCDIFGVPEWTKNRRRRVVNPVSVNDAYGRDTLPPLFLPSRKQIRDVAFHGTHVCCLDASSFFDQFPIHDDIGLNFCFRDKRGILWCLSALAMGQRHASHIATALMRIVCSFAHPDVAVDIATDNVRFVGSRENVARATAAFLGRCKVIGLVINDVSKDPSAADIDAMVTQEADFLGEIINYRDKTVFVRKKITDRIQQLWDLRATWTHRQLLGLFACLLWCRAPLAVDMTSHYGSMCALRDLSRILQADPDTWEKRVTLSPEAFDDVAEWTRHTLANAPTPIADPHDKEDFVLITDASYWGWGACTIVDERMARALQAPWGTSLPEADRRFSTATEPEAIWRALVMTLPVNVKRTVVILTDHAPFVHAVNRGYSASSRSNAILSRIKRRYPLATFRATHIPGATNPVDQLSREWVSRPSADIALRRAHNMGVHMGFYPSLSPVS